MPWGLLGGEAVWFLGLFSGLYRAVCCYWVMRVGCGVRGLVVWLSGAVSKSKRVLVQT